MEILQARSRLTYHAVRFTVDDLQAIQEWLIRLGHRYTINHKHELSYCCSIDHHFIARVEHGDYIVVSEHGVSVYTALQYKHLYEELTPLSSTK